MRLLWRLAGMAGVGFVVAAMAGGSVPSPVAAAEKPAPTIILSTENTPDHVQTRVLRLYAERLTARLDGRLRVEVHDRAELFNDRDVTEAVAAGRVDMAAPGLWHLDRYEPNFAIFLLPMFYGRDDAANHALRDGAVGEAIARRLEAAMDVHVLGRWIDLGPAHVFTRGKPITSAADFDGLRIRVAGGEGNALRIRALGADSRIIPWPELPRALADDAIDGALTTAATVVSAGLWSVGLDHAYLDRQYFPQYVPIVSRRLWTRLPSDVRGAMTAEWEALVLEARSMAAADQASALTVLAANRVAIVEPAADDLAATREALMAGQDAMVTALGLDPDLVAAVAAALE